MTAEVLVLDRLGRLQVGERQGALSFADAYQEGARRLVIPTGVAIEGLFSSIPSEEAMHVQQSMALLLAAQMVAQSCGLTNEKAQQEFLAQHGVDTYVLDDQATALLEHVLLQRTQEASNILRDHGKSSLFMEAALSAAAMEAVLRRAMGNLAGVAENGKEVAGNTAWSHLRSITRILRQVSHEKLTAEDAIKKVGQHLIPLLFMSPQVETRQLEDLTQTPNAKALYQTLISLPIDGAQRRRLIGGGSIRVGEHDFSAETVTIAVNGVAETISARIGRHEQAVRTVFQKAKVPDTWDEMTRSEQISASLLLLFQGAPVIEKIKMVLSDPEMVRAFSKLPASLQEQLQSWTQAAWMAKAVDRGAAQYARDLTGLRGTAERALATAKQRASAFARWFSDPVNSNQPDGPRRPHKGHILITLGLVTGSAIVAYLLAACAKANQTQTPTPSPEHPLTPGTIDLIASLHQSLSAQLASFQITADPGCTVSPTVFESMQASGAAITANTQFGWLESSLKASNMPAIPQNARLVCAISADNNTASIYLRADQTVLIPTSGGFVEGEVKNGIAIPNIPTPEVSYSAPYPLNADHFLLGGGGSIEQAWKTLEALAPNDVAIQRAYFNAEFARMGISSEHVELVPMYIFSPNVNAWVITAYNKDTGKYYIPAERHVDPNSQEVTHLIISSLSLFTYEDHVAGDDFFDLIELKNPSQYPDAKQQLVADESGWFVIGLFDKSGKLVGYYDAGVDAWKDTQGVLLESVVIATNTPDIPRPTISSNLSPQNAATTVLENGQWVTKNPDGLVTAAYTPETGWMYEYSQLAYQSVEINNYDMVDPAARPVISNEAIARALESATHDQFTLDNKPVATGTVFYITAEMTGIDGDFTDKEVAVVTLFGGIQFVETRTINRQQRDFYHAFFLVPVAPDKVIVLVKEFNTSTHAHPMNRFYGGNIESLKENNPELESVRHKGLKTEAEVIQFLQNQSLIGQQAIVYFSYDRPAGFHGSEMNGDSRALIDAIERRQLPQPLSVMIFNLRELGFPAELFGQ